jgi:hypothetical protein
VVCDVYDLAALSQALAAFHPDAVMHQLTDLPDAAEEISELGWRNDRMRREGTRNLLTAARAAEATRFYAQSLEAPRRARRNRR